ncbi:MAG: hypothetical protein K8F25_06585 [Fimbriimonadaceae bacterium]|nr:hypothetical protein [Alphaproteobacteria bacterium]
MKSILNIMAAGVMAASIAGPAHAATDPQRVQVTGEIIDTWCYVTEIMYAQGTAHHKCAVWCAVGGIPVSIRDGDGKVYMVLRIEDDDTSVANEKIVKIQTHQVTVDGDLYVRDGVNYLIVNQVATDKGVVNLTHEDYGIQPFGE